MPCLLSQRYGRYGKTVSSQKIIKMNHIELIKSGAERWNKWKKRNPDLQVDISEQSLGDIKLPAIDLSGAIMDRIKLRWAYLRLANLKGASLKKADLRIIDLSQANLSNANLEGADLSGAYLRQVNLANANLKNCKLFGVNFDRANLTNANLEGAILRNSTLTDVNLDNANLTGCNIYGTSVWNISTQNTIQKDLIISKNGEATISVDNIKIGQFIHLMLNNKEIRDVIDTIGKKGVLILGRFYTERKEILDALRISLRNFDLVPIIFDFEKPNTRDLTETISTLAHLSKFVIADITDAKSIPQELKAIIPNLPSLPIQPIIFEEYMEYSMFKDFGGFLSVSAPFIYKSKNHLLESIEEAIIKPVDNKIEEIETRRKIFEESLRKN